MYLILFFDYFVPICLFYELVELIQTDTTTHTKLTRLWNILFYVSFVKWVVFEELIIVFTGFP